MRWPPSCGRPIQFSSRSLPHPGAHWHGALEARDRARAAESQLVLAFHAAQAKDREEREAAEDRSPQRARRGT